MTQVYIYFEYMQLVTHIYSTYIYIYIYIIWQILNVTQGCDTVLSSYQHTGPAAVLMPSSSSSPSSPLTTRFHEIEQKYTQYVNLESRETLPRLDMTPFVCVLNLLETQARAEHVPGTNSAKSDL